MVPPIQDLDERGTDDVFWDIIKGLLVAWDAELLQAVSAITPGLASP